MPVETGELRRLLVVFNDRSGASASAVVTRSGVPLAWSLPDGSHAENFGTMTATLIGALEVIYTGLRKPSPEEIVVETASGALVAQTLTPKAFVVATTDRLTPEFRKALEDLARQTRGYLTGAEPD